MTQRLCKVSDWPLNTEFIFLEETVLELLFEFGVSPFQFGFFIEPLNKLKDVIVWDIKCMGMQGKKIRITHCYILFLGEKKL